MKICNGQIISSGQVPVVSESWFYYFLTDSYEYNNKLCCLGPYGVYSVITRNLHNFNIIFFIYPVFILYLLHREQNKQIRIFHKLLEYSNVGSYSNFN